MSAPALLVGRLGVCSIDVKYVEFSWRQPWQRLSQEAAYGTGFCIAGHSILTNAHVVNAAVDIRVRLHGSPTRYKAHVKVYAPDVDLAILKLSSPDDEDEFFYDSKPNNSRGNEEGSHDKKESIALEFSDALPNLRERVHVTGFPTGGNTICVTEGVVSRIDVRGISPDGRFDVLCIQIDAAINSGNSGGPVFDKTGKVTGVAFQKSKNGSHDNIGYIISASTVRAFLSRCHDDGTYTFAPSHCYTFCNLFNRSLRLAHQVPEAVKGVLLTTVSETCPFLQKGDVLTKVDDYELANDGQVYLRHDELISHLFVFSGKHLDEPVVFTVYRDGELITSDPIVLHHLPYLFRVFPFVDHQPDYLFIGPALFVPCSYGLAYQAKEPSSLLRGSIKRQAMQWPHEWQGGRTEIVLLLKIMAHDESFDYSRPWSQALSYNGTPIKSLEHLRDLWKNSCDQAFDEQKKNPDEEIEKHKDDKSKEHQFARIELEFQDDLVFEVKAALKAQSDVMQMHNIPDDSVILPPNPKYRFTYMGPHKKHKHGNDDDNNKTATNDSEPTIATGTGAAPP